eukprot:3295132-Rhodomonas_salina.11
MYCATDALGNVRYPHRLSFYCGFGMRWPVLTPGILLRVRYAMSGTDLGYRATRHWTESSLLQTGMLLRYLPTRVLYAVGY